VYIHSLYIRNFRRLKDIHIDLAVDISIFVGANNSGKTSTSQAMQLFLAASGERFSIHDFNADSWPAIDAFGEQTEGAKLPTISLDIWFHVEDADLHRVVELLPSLSWRGSMAGVRIEFGASDEALLLARFGAARDLAKANSRPPVNGRPEYHPPPRTLREYLDTNLRQEFELRYYVLDCARFDAAFVPLAGYVPLQLTTEKGRSGRDIVASLLKVDFLSAQRHLSDAAGGSRAEELSRCLSRFYARNLEKRANDYDATRALSDSEAMLNEHLARVFAPTLQRLAELGYPGLSNPRLLIKSALNPAIIMNSQDGARVHYALGPSGTGLESPTLPDRYNGLGFKNLIYMVVELLDLHARWLDIEESRPPLHLIFIEEPEAHLHAQLQQVFIRKVLDLLLIEGADVAFYRSQVIVTTHSPHILYERGFQPIRYFRRVQDPLRQSSEVLNLSAFYAQTANPTRDFLERYLKLTHCDLFFADAAVLVEGNVERLLLPLMIEKVAPRLKSAYLSILEIGGAFGHRFRTLIEFLGLTALIITDIDSVRVIVPPAMPDEFDLADDPVIAAGTACMTDAPSAVTSNQTLLQWLPAKSAITDLLGASVADRIQLRTNECHSLVSVTYQRRTTVNWRDMTYQIAGRTLEEAFALENLVWCQDKDRAALKLRIRGNEKLTLDTLSEALHKRVQSSSFNKTDFALGLLAENPASWIVPSYIAEGLAWLEQEIMPAPLNPIAGKVQDRQ
jgi:predicted ATP-dependent endonuclease of OLD family